MIDYGQFLINKSNCLMVIQNDLAIIDTHMMLVEVLTSIYFDEGDLAQGIVRVLSFGVLFFVLVEFLNEFCTLLSSLFLEFLEFLLPLVSLLLGLISIALFGNYLDFGHITFVLFWFLLFVSSYSLLLPRLFNH